MTTVASLSLVPHLLIKPSFRCLSRKGVGRYGGIKGVGRYGGIKVYAVLRDDSADYLKDNHHWEALFHVDDPGPRVPIEKGQYLEAKQALDVVRFDIQYCDWRARQDLLTIMVLHNKGKVVEVLNPLARDFKSVGNLRKDLDGLQEELAKAHNQLYLSESRVSSALDKLAQMETVVNERLLSDGSAFANTADCASLDPSTSLDTTTSTSSTVRVGAKKPKRRSLNISGPVKPYSANLKNFWYPVAFSSDLKDDTMVPIDCFEEQWVIFRGKDKRPGCVQNTCAHRACPLDLGSVNEGRITCPYHGWEYSTDGKCEKMPSTKMLNVRIRALPCFEQEGMVWIWPGDDTPTPTIPSLLPPSGFTIHAEIVMELPVEHGLLLDNLLDLAHAPFTHTSTFAKGWSVPSFVKFLTPTSGLQGYWDPYPIDMEFRPPCMVLSTIGISKPGKLEGKSTQQCATHLHQLHVLNEDLRLVLGQQDRMNNGANVWNWPVSYDKLGIRYRLWRGAGERGGDRVTSYDRLGIRYRLWRDAVERGVDRLPFSNEIESGS
uniref:Chlorophyllide a oxygenase, chloroplastic n=1 Tax=Aegilops tauschii TaxID=37682 RepID=M8AXE7_AEGTA